MNRGKGGDDKENESYDESRKKKLNDENKNHALSTAYMALNFLGLSDFLPH